MIKGYERKITQVQLKGEKPNPLKEGHWRIWRINFTRKLYF